MGQVPRTPSLGLIREFQRIIIASARIDVRASASEGRRSMESYKQFSDEETWTAAEKKTARRAFDNAFARHCARITAEARRMLENVTAPSNVWQVEEYLSDHRRKVDAIYDYRYSRLLMVFSRLMRDGWLAEADLAGLDQEKIAKIKMGANL